MTRAGTSFSERAAIAGRVGDVALLRNRLHRAASLDELMSVAADEARRVLGFSRALVAYVDDGLPHARGVAPLAHDASDRLRRRLLAKPLPAPDRWVGCDARQVLCETLGLEHHVIAWIMGVSCPTAVLIADRPGPGVGAEEARAADLFANLVSGAFECLSIEASTHALAAELRNSTASVNLLMEEAVTAPVVLPVDHGMGPVFPAADTANAGAVCHLLSPRERQVLALIVAGYTNKRIAAELHVAADTVKAHVSRVLRKLGVTNRLEAAARYQHLAQSCDAR